MTHEQVMAQDVAAVIEETSEFITNRLVLNTLSKEGKVSLEEAQYLSMLTSEVLQEAAEEIIPDYIEVPDLPTGVPTKQPVEEASTATETIEELTESEVIVNKLLQQLL